MKIFCLREPDCDGRRIASFCKLLDDAGEFADDSRGAAAELRLRVFTLAARYHPLVESADRIFERPEAEVKNLIAAELSRPWAEIEKALYVDVIDFQPLLSFAGYPDAAALLSRYNVAQLQACLFKAQSMTVFARRDFKSILRYAKLARLLLDIRRIDATEYRIDFTGPASCSTKRADTASTSPASFPRCWRARIGTFAPNFARRGVRGRSWPCPARTATRAIWRRKTSLTLRSSNYSPRSSAPSRKGARLEREAEILHQKQITFVPDFAFRHQEGRQVLMEIVGFWTPEYLRKKRETLRQFHQHKILLAVAERSIREGAAIPPDVIVYKTTLKVEAVLELLRQVK